MNVDSVTRSQFLKAFAWLYAVFGLIGFPFLGLVSLLVAVLPSFLLSFVVLFISDKIGSMAGNVYSGPQANWTKSETAAADLNRARHQKVKQDYDLSLKIVNSVLKEYPELPEALYLKAEILVEGYSNPEAAKGYLVKILNTAPETETTIRQWASSLYEKLTQSP